MDIRVLRANSLAAPATVLPILLFIVQLILQKWMGG
jgi:hypothetical protein